MVVQIEFLRKFSYVEALFKYQKQTIFMASSALPMIRTLQWGSSKSYMPKWCSKEVKLSALSQYFIKYGDMRVGRTQTIFWNTYWCVSRLHFLPYNFQLFGYGFHMHSSIKINPEHNKYNLECADVLFWQSSHEETQ